VGKDVKVGVGLALAIFLLLFVFLLMRSSDEKVTPSAAPETHADVAPETPAEEGFTTAEEVLQIDVELSDHADTEARAVFEGIPPEPPEDEEAELVTDSGPPESGPAQPPLSQPVDVVGPAVSALGPPVVEIVEHPGPQPTTYTVQKDDALWSLAERFYGEGRLWKKIRDANQDLVGSDNRIIPGAVLVIPPLEPGQEVTRMVEAAPPAPAPSEDSTYVVKKGDTLYSIARRHYGDGRLWRVIHQANQDRVPDPNSVPVGTELVLPPRPAGGN